MNSEFAFASARNRPTTVPEPTPLSLLRSFVDNALNGERLSVISDLFSPSFEDHDPIVIPGILPMDPRGRSGLSDIHAITRFFSQSRVDFKFVVEQAFEHEDCVAYRLFGQGYIGLETDDSSESLGLFRRLAVTNANMAASTVGFAEGTILGDRYLVVVTRVGMYRVANGRLVEHWGQAVVK